MKIISLNTPERQLLSLSKRCQTDQSTIKIAPSSPSSTLLLHELLTHSLGLALYTSPNQLNDLIAPFNMPLCINLDSASFDEDWKEVILSLQRKDVSLFLIGHRLWISFLSDEVVEWGASGVLNCEETCSIY